MRAIFACALVVVAGLPASADGLAHMTPHQARRVTPVVEVVQRALPSVVNISTTRIVETRRMGRGVFGGLFPEIFNVPSQMTTNSVGSGSIIHEKGYVLTNAHVVAQADELIVQLADGQKLPARLVASLPEDDVAVLKVDAPAPLPAIALGRSDDLMVGETAIAIGNPVGLGHTVTTGIVSALDRELSPARGVTFTGIIQTDAAINPGNSGGPLLNILGEQIGVTTAIRSDAQNVGFAISIERVKALLPTMLGVEQRGRFALGLTLGLSTEGEVVVEDAARGTPAAKAGLARGQRVVRIGERPADALMDALIALQEQPVGRPFVVVTRDGTREREHRVVIEEIPPPDGQRLCKERFGLRLVSMDAAMAARLGVKPSSALVVDAITPGSEAEQVGFWKGDLVTRVGPYGVRTLDELGLLLEHVKKGDDVAFRVVRVHRGRVSQSDVVLTAR